MVVRYKINKLKVKLNKTGMIKSLVGSNGLTEFSMKKVVFWLIILHWVGFGIFL